MPGSDLHRRHAGGRSSGWAWGVGHVLELIAAEMKVAMTLTGVTRVDQLDRNALA